MKLLLVHQQPFTASPQFSEKSAFQPQTVEANLEKFVEMGIPVIDTRELSLEANFLNLDANSKSSLRESESESLTSANSNEIISAWAQAFPVAEHLINQEMQLVTNLESSVDTSDASAQAQALKTEIAHTNYWKAIFSTLERNKDKIWVENSFVKQLADVEEDDGEDDGEDEGKVDITSDDQLQAWFSDFSSQVLNRIAPVVSATASSSSSQLTAGEQNLNLSLDSQQQSELVGYLWEMMSEAFKAYDVAQFKNSKIFKQLKPGVRLIDNDSLILSHPEHSSSQAPNWAENLGHFPDSVLKAILLSQTSKLLSNLVVSELEHIYRDQLQGEIEEVYNLIADYLPTKEFWQDEEAFAKAQISIQALVVGFVLLLKKLLNQDWLVRKNEWIICVDAQAILHSNFFAKLKGFTQLKLAVDLVNISDAQRDELVNQATSVAEFDALRMEADYQVPHAYAKAKHRYNEKTDSYWFVKTAPGYFGVNGFFIRASTISQLAQLTSHSPIHQAKTIEHYFINVNGNSLKTAFIRGPWVVGNCYYRLQPATQQEHNLITHYFSKVTNAVSNYVAQLQLTASLEDDFM